MRVPYSVLIAAIVLTAQAAVAGGLYPKVVVAPAPLKPYVDEILHGYGESASLLRPGQDAHDFTLAPTQVEALAGADILIVPELKLNPVLKRLLAANKKALVIELTALPGANTLPYSAKNPWLDALKDQVEEAQRRKDKKEKNTAKKPDEHDHDHDHAQDEDIRNDPHLWLDPERMAAISAPLAGAIAERMPEAKADLAHNAKALASHLRREVTPQLQKILSGLPRTENAMTQAETPFLTYHAAYQYFLERFGLTHYGELVQRPEDFMGARSTSAMFEQAGKMRVRCLIGEQKTVLMERVAKQTGARLVLVSPEQLVDRHNVDALEWLKNDYDRFLYNTAKAFAGCL